MTLAELLVATLLAAGTAFDLGEYEDSVQKPFPASNETRSDSAISDRVFSQTCEQNWIAHFAGGDDPRWRHLHDRGGTFSQQDKA